jgi:hypothetical protein
MIYLRGLTFATPLPYNYRMLNTLVSRLRTTVLAGLCVAAASTAHAEATAFRISDLDWRDPHLFTTISGLGCADLTNFDAFGVKGINPSLQDMIQTDTDSDGKLDLNYLFVFDPLNQAGPNGTLRFGANVTCTAPLGTTVCSPLTLLPSYAYDNTPSLCLAPVVGTTSGYNPAVTASTAPCFVAALGTLTFSAPFPITLQDAYIAAQYQGSPANALVNGLIRGFISEASANNTIMPANMAVIGGKSLSSLLRGGVSSCSQPSPAVGDKDIGPGGVTGWYVYLNFIATVVPLVSATPVLHTLPSLLELDAPAPNPFNPTTTIRYALPRAASVDVSIYDAAGRRIASLVNGWQPAGPHQELWDGRDALGQPASSGVYFVRLESAGEKRVQKMVLLK